MCRKVELLGEEIEYSTVRSENATQPRIDVDIHEVKVVLPQNQNEDIDPGELVRENANWIIEKKRKYENYRERAPNREFKPGKEFPYLGSQRTLRIEDTSEKKITDEEIILPEQGVTEESPSECIRRHLRELYREKAREIIERRTAYYADEMEVSYESIELRNQRTRWGSCSPKKTLSFNWRLIMAPLGVIDYVVVHELAHLKEKNHTKKFWRIVKDYIPDYKEKAEWLEENSSRLIFSEEDL